MSSSVEKGSGSLDPGERPASGSQPKACTACNTTKTPLWRGGPSGPMSLCNACGIRYRKKRREALGIDEPPKKRQPAAAAAAPAAAAACSEAGGESADPEQQQQQPKKKTTTTKRGREVELRVVGFGKEVVLKQRRRMRRRPRLGEEEKAAILLMALSSGVIYG